MIVRNATTEPAPVVLRIGEVAKLTGLTSRTLRYWEELDLLRPSGYRGSGERLYSQTDMARVTRIRDLQELLGFSLAEVRVVLDTEDIDVLDRLRSEFRWGDATSGAAPAAARRGHRGQRQAVGAPRQHAGPDRRLPGRAGRQVGPSARGPPRAR